MLTDRSKEMTMTDQYFRMITKSSSSLILSDITKGIAKKQKDNPT
jgi:hypothetical protein